MKHFGDITKIRGADVPPVDAVIGGSPCQGLSIAGRRAGLADERSGLFMEQIRVIKEMRRSHGKPRWMVWENVPGAFSSNKGEDFGAVLHETIRIVCPKAPPCFCTSKWMVHKRLHRGRRMEPCVARSRCTVLGSPPAPS